MFESNLYAVDCSIPGPPEGAARLPAFAGGLRRSHATSARAYHDAPRCLLCHP